MNKIYDKEFRANLTKDPKKYIQELSYTLDDDMEVIVKTNDKNTTYITMPSSDILNNSMNQIQAASGAGSASTVGSVGSASTIATLTSTASTGGSAASLGTAGTAG